MTPTESCGIDVSESILREGRSNDTGSAYCLSRVLGVDNCTESTYKENNAVGSSCPTQDRSDVSPKSLVTSRVRNQKRYTKSDQVSTVKISGNTV